jgi:propanediol dehydratase large subunit
MYLFSLHLPARARPADHVEVVARLRRRRWVDCLHQLLKDHQGGQAAHTTAVKREQAEVVAVHDVRVLNDTTWRNTKVKAARWERGVVFGLHTGSRLRQALLAQCSAPSACGWAGVRLPAAAGVCSVEESGQGTLPVCYEN